MSLTVADIIALTIAVVVVLLTIFMIAEAWLGRSEPTEDGQQLTNRPYDRETDGL